jgi:WD40 repeat protein
VPRLASTGGHSVSANPFMGPQPYRAADRHRFFGREDVTQELANYVLAHPCVTLFGESGAGKSSLMQAGVIPHLGEAYGFRTVRIDGWLADQAPLQRLVQALFTDLALGPIPEALEPSESIDLAVDLALQRSKRPILIYLDQLEQLFLPERAAGETESLLENLEALARKPIRGLQLVLSLREDYLGRFRERARGQRELLEQGFRLGPLTVGEMAKVAYRIAAVSDLAQPWSEDELRELMVQVRMPGQAPTEQAEVQSAFAQIVCRALWEERMGKETTGPALAEPMLHRYLEATLEGLGSWKQYTQRLLEEHLIDGEGRRTVLMEQSARKALAGLSEEEAAMVLRHLEDAAVLHAEEHQGSRYFELGHDWLASKVFELRRDRVRQEQEAERFRQEQTRRAEEARQLREEQARQEREAARKLQRAQAERRKLMLLTGGALIVALLMGLLFLWALGQKSAAVQARGEAERAQARAREHALMAGAREWVERSDGSMAAKLLLEVNRPEQALGWEKLALDVLVTGMPVATLRCHEGVADAAFSPDGERVAIACGDGTVQLWEADGSGEPIILRGHYGTVWSVRFSPDGRRIVTASYDQTARVWMADASGESLVLRGHEDSVEFAVFSPDGRRIVTASYDQTARVWMADASGEPLVLREHEAPVYSAVFSPDGQHIITESMDERAQIWKATGTGEPLRSEWSESWGKLAAFSPDGQRIVTVHKGKPNFDKGTFRDIAMVMKAASSDVPFVLEGHEGSIQFAAFSPDGQRIVTASEDRTARVWTADGSGKSFELSGHEGPVESAAFSPDGQRIITLSGRTVRVWKADGSDKPLVLRGHKDSIRSAFFSPDGQRIITVSYDLTARVWQAAGSSEPLVLRGHKDSVRSAAFSPDGQHIVTASEDGTAQVWKADGSGKPIVLHGHKYSVRSAAFSPDGQRIVTASNDRTVRVWKADGSGEPLVLYGHDGSVESVAFSPDGQRIVTASNDRTVRVWKADGSGEPLVLRGHEGPIESAAFSPDGQRIVTASDETVRVWKADGSGEPLVLLKHDYWVLSAAFSPDGQRIVTASNDRTVRVWKADGSGEPLVLRGHESRVRFAAFSPDGQHIISASDDKTARVWKADGSGEPLVLRGHESGVRFAAFSPDGHRIVTASDDGMARVWPGSISRLQQALREANMDCLPPEIRRTYLDESNSQAQERYEACERSFGRTPFFPDAP